MLWTNSLLMDSFDVRSTLLFYRTERTYSFLAELMVCFKSFWESKEAAISLASLDGSDLSWRLREFNSCTACSYLIFKPALASLTLQILMIFYILAYSKFSANSSTLPPQSAAGSSALSMSVSMLFSDSFLESVLFF